MNVFETVKQSVTTRQAAEHYGIHVGRNGMACCPFHHDKTPSMKLDRRYHCFGCGADGDVIDFAAALYGLGKKEAAVQLAQDFGLSYEDWKPPGKAKKPKPRQKSPEEQFQEAKNRCFRILTDYLHLLMAWRTDYAPHSPEEAFHPRFVEALQKQDQVEYLLDVLLFGETEEKAALIMADKRDGSVKTRQRTYATRLKKQWMALWRSQNRWSFHSENDSPLHPLLPSRCRAGCRGKSLISGFFSFITTKTTEK